MWLKYKSNWIYEFKNHIANSPVSAPYTLCPFWFSYLQLDCISSHGSIYLNIHWWDTGNSPLLFCLRYVPSRDIKCLISKTDTSAYSTSVRNTVAQNRVLFLWWFGYDFSVFPKLPHVNSIKGEMQVPVWVSHSFSKPIPRESFSCIY